MAGRLDHSRLAEIDAKVAHYGWKIVFISRLVPVLPYFVANYTFGLSKISLRSFVLATFFGLMPLTVSYVLFSANLSDLLQGKLSLWFLISACMVAIIIIVPFIFNSNIFRKNID